MSKSTVSLIVLALFVAGLGPGCDDGAAPAPAARASAPAPSARQTTAPAKKRVRPRPPARSPSATVPEGDPIAAALAEPELFSRLGRLAALLPTLGPDSVPVVQALLGGLRDGTQSFGMAECALLTEYWSLHDPEGAARWALFSSPPAYKTGLMVPAVEHWAAKDPQEVAATVSEFLLIPGAHTEQAEVALTRGWFDSGEPGLVDYIHDLGIGFRRQRLIATYASKSVERDGPEAATRWAESLPDDDQRFKLAAYRQTAKAVARVEPLVAAAWCEAQCDGPFGDSVRTMVAQHWAWRDGPAAMQWVSQAVPGKDRDWAVKGAFRGWWPGDRAGFIDWASGLEQEGSVPAWFEPAIELYCSGLARMEERPEYAIHWASYIQNDQDRERTLINISHIWGRQDETAAKAWLETSPLSPEARDKARNPVAGRGFKPFPNPEAP